MAISSFEGSEEKYVKSSKDEMAITRLLGQKSKKIRTLSFLQLLKFEKAKCPYIFNLWPRSRDMAILSFDDFTFFTSEPSKDEMAISRLLGHK